MFRISNGMDWPIIDVETAGQSREQFLTARLNAQSALAQTMPSGTDLWYSDTAATQSERDEAKIQLRWNRIKIELLAREAKLRFDGGPWTPVIEKQAIHDYFVGCVKWLVSASDRATGNGQRQETPRFMEATRQQLVLLNDVIRKNHPLIPPVIEATIQTLQAHMADPESAISLCRDMHRLYPPNQPPWV
jgi:hypothetical protein